jgi:hypothetical protein
MLSAFSVVIFFNIRFIGANGLIWWRKKMCMSGDAELVWRKNLKITKIITTCKIQLFSWMKSRESPSRISVRITNPAMKIRESHVLLFATVAL